jgi:hypothetical protein
MIIVTNLISLILHLFMRIIIIFLSITIGLSSALITSEEDRLARLLFQEKKSWTIFIISIVMYFILGLMIKSNRKKLSNLLAVSLTSIIGLILLFAYFFNVKYIFGLNVYDMYIFYSCFDIPNFNYHLNVISNVNVLIINIIFVLVPSLFMWLGLETNRKFIKK